jgi:hypothetical protein
LERGAWFYLSVRFFEEVQVFMLPNGCFLAKLARLASDWQGSGSWAALVHNFVSAV